MPDIKLIAAELIAVHLNEMDVGDATIRMCARQFGILISDADIVQVRDRLDWLAGYLEQAAEQTARDES